MGILTIVASYLIIITSGLESIETEPYVVSQSMGYAGLISLGMGIQITDYYETDILLGFVPKKFAGEHLWSLTWKNTLIPYIHEFDDNIIYTPIHFGVSTLISLDEDTFLFLPNQYPEEYIPPTKILFAFNLGSKVRFNRQEVYFEFSALEYYFMSYLENRNTIRPSEIIAIGLGYRYFFLNESTNED
jgi:hypothetical protein